MHWRDLESQTELSARGQIMAGIPSRRGATFIARLASVANRGLAIAALGDVVMKKVARRFSVGVLLAVGASPGCEREAGPPAQEKATATATLRSWISLQELEGVLPVRAARCERAQIRSRFTDHFAREAEAKYEAPDGTYLTLSIVDGGGAPVMNAAGDMERPERGQDAVAGYRVKTSIDGYQTLYRLNPPGGYFGGELKIFVGDRFVVRASGSRLMMETISDAANSLARKVAALRSGRG